ARGRQRAVRLGRAWRRRAADGGAPRLDRADQSPDRHLHLLLPDPPLDARCVPRGRLTVPDTSRRRRVSWTGKVLAGVVVALVVADLTGLTSDQARRDSAIRERGLETDRFPETTFTLTAPITLPSAPVRGTSYRVTATGDLTLHGVTRSVQVALEAKWNGATIAV